MAEPVCFEDKINGKTCRFYGSAEAENVLIQPADENEGGHLEEEISAIRNIASRHKFMLAAVPVQNWNSELSPWDAPAVFRGQVFGHGANEFLKYITEELIPYIRRNNKACAQISFCIGGYSLAGLFALWAVYQTDLFTGAAGVSPSLWFPGFSAYTELHRPLAGRIYLSLGNKEPHTRNQIMATVGDCVCSLHQRLVQNKNIQSVFEWNAGNHFTEPERRTAAGFAWLLNSGDINEKK